jgi:hypothetical protein
MSFDMNSPNPYAPSSTPPTAPKKSNVLTYVLIGVGAVVLLSCCGCVAAMFGLGRFGLNVMAQGVRPTVQNDPVVKEHIGDLQKISTNFMESSEETGKHGNQANKRFVFDVEGSKGKGKVVGTVIQNGADFRLEDSELRMPSGETHKMSQ